MIGEQIGKWTIVRKISQGGMADVYLAEGPASNKGKPEQAAIKLLRVEELESNDSLFDRFHREADILRALKHENIVQLFESGEFRGRPYLIMEFVDGLSLDRVLEQRGKLTWEEVVVIGQMVASALKFAHRQEVIHRDLKPANLLADWNRHVKLTDFGIARLLHDEQKLTKENAIIGTASYLSPEQAAGKQATRKSDLYSLGIILYELLTGRLPFEADNAAEILHKHRYAQFELPSRLVESVPHDFDKLIEALLEKDPDRRPINALAVEEALNKLKRKFDRQKQYTPKPASPATKVIELDGQSDSEIDLLRDKIRRRRSAFPLVQALALMLAMAGVVGLWFWLRQPSSAATLTSSIERLLNENDWSAAQAKYDQLVKFHAESVPKEERDELQARINSSKSYTQAKIISGPFTFSPPTSEAERFYRSGVLAYYSCRLEDARSTWSHVVQAFKDIPAYSAWVRLSEEALKQIDTPPTFNLNAILKTFADADPKNVKERLIELQKLYQSLPDSEWKTSALKEIGEKLKGM